MWTWSIVYGDNADIYHPAHTSSTSLERVDKVQTDLNISYLTMDRNVQIW